MLKSKEHNTERIMVSMPESLKEKVAELADEAGISRSEAVRQLISYGLTRGE